MRIALTTHSVNPRGGVVHALELASALVGEGHDVTLFAPAAPGEALFREPPCRVVLAIIDGSQRGTEALVEARLRALKTSLQADRPRSFDILHAQDSISGNALAELKHEGEIDAFVRTVHHLDHFDNPRLAAWQTRAWRDADRVLCVSETWTREMLVSHGVRATTVTNGVDLTRYQPTPGAPDLTLRQRLGINGSPLVLAVGGVEQRKNTLALLEAFALTRNSYPGACLVVAGGASLLDHHAYGRLFLQRLAELDLDHSVILTGPLDDADIPPLLRSADVLAMVSLREGFGLVVLEALACGTPVVASKIAPFTEYLDESLCCWAIPTEPASIAAALERVLDGRFRTDFRHAVPALLTRMSWRASARKHIDIYQGLLARLTPPSLKEPPCRSCTFESSGPTTAKPIAIHLRKWLATSSRRAKTIR